MQKKNWGKTRKKRKEIKAARFFKEELVQWREISDLSEKTWAKLEAVIFLRGSHDRSLNVEIIE